ncbi:hypothetical protein DPEC_G00010700 [Dallia pectoralis]|uniref:Uncharacterized protein n=1 Tax=Dallia pectoralis TaxID=75939 RepID=A0ACC2HL71_DALPE|nr:hypothetical protein DPEC_G00010700 [Dallia pectoralis]
MTRPFILNTVSPRPSVRKGLLISAPNRPSVSFQWVEGGQRMYALGLDEGSWTCPLARPRTPHPAISRSLPPSRSPSADNTRVPAPVSARQARGPMPGPERAGFNAAPCVTFPFAGALGFEEEERVEWFSCRTGEKKWYLPDTLPKKGEEEEERNLF